MADCLPLAASSERPWLLLAPPRGLPGAFLSASESNDEQHDEAELSLHGATLEGSSPTTPIVVGLRPSYRHAGRSPFLAPSNPPLPSLSGPHGASGVRYQPFSGAPRSLTASQTTLAHQPPFHITSAGEFSGQASDTLVALCFRSTKPLSAWHWPLPLTATHS